MYRAHKIRIYPDAAQEKVLRDQVGGSRFVYNWALERWRQWVEDKKNGTRIDSPNWVKLSRIWTTERPEWASCITRSVVTYAIKSVNLAFTRHFKNGTGWPKFKKKGYCRDAFRLENSAVTIRADGLHIRFPLIPKDIRMSERLRYKGKILGYSVCVVGGRWYVSVRMEVEDGRTAPHSVCGVDVGMKTPAICSDGSELRLPAKKLARLDKHLRKISRRVSRTDLTSKRRAKALRRKQRVQQCINNIRRDAIHKFTSKVCKSHDTVVIESLSLNGMHRRPHLGHATQSSCMHETLRQLTYKAICLVTADRMFPSTQICSRCGHRHKLTLDTRTYKCPKCGLSLDRDLNAAINLSKYPGSQG